MNSKVSLDEFNILKHKPGSTEAQIFIFTQKVASLTVHLKNHHKDYSSQRGLRKILGQRKRLLTYLYNQDTVKYENLINKLGIRGTKKISVK